MDVPVRHRVQKGLAPTKLVILGALDLVLALETIRRCVKVDQVVD